jgi:hypothetical protein
MIITFLKGGNTMKKRDTNEQYGFFYDEDGTNVVSQQIMDSYNSGVMEGTNQDDVQSDEQTNL